MDAKPLRYDVAVIGGGAAGLAAALGAARLGARTALVERYGFLGGMATAGMVGTICGLYRTSASGPPEMLNPGVGEEIVQRLAAIGGGSEPVRRGRTFVLPYAPFAFAGVADDMTTAAPGLDVFLHAYLVDVGAADCRVETLRVATWERSIELIARAVVDASGDAVVAHRAGAPTEWAPATDRQLPSLVFVLQDVDAEALDGGARVALLRGLVTAEREGRIPKGASNLSLARSRNPGEVICKLALGGLSEERPAGLDYPDRRRAGGAPPSARGGRGAEGDCRLSRGPSSPTRRLRSASARAAAPWGAISSRARTCSAPAGSRTPCAGRAGPSSSGRTASSGRPTSTSKTAPSTRSRSARSARAGSTTCSWPGRCMSATHEALGSARVIGTALATGEAAGRAAARLADGADPAPGARA